MPPRIVRPVWLIIAFFALAILGYAGNRWYLTGPIIDVGWKTSQFFFSYQELGFVKRGLVGTLLHPFPALQTVGFFWGISWGFVFAFALLFSLLLARGASALSRSDTRLLVAICALSPALYLRQGFDVGRFDQVGLIATLGAIWAIDSGLLWLAGAMAAVGLLVHEAYALIGLPLLGSYWLRRNEKAGTVGPFWRNALALAWLPALAVTAIAWHGNYRPGFDRLVAHFSASPRYMAAVKGELNGDALAVLTRGLGENVRYAAEVSLSKRVAFHLPIIIAWGAVMTAFFGQFFRVNSLRRDGLFYASFAPLALGFLAYDYYRWVALAATNMLIVILISCRDAAAEGRTIRIPHGWVTKLLLATCLLGPISNTTSFPLALTWIDRHTSIRLPWR